LRSGISTARASSAGNNVTRQDPIKDETSRRVMFHAAVNRGGDGSVQ
jgi:hypothetical protein